MLQAVIDRSSLRRCLRPLYLPSVPIVFGTFNASTVTAEEAKLSQSLQTSFANFVKDPKGAFPAPNWSAYKADASVPTLAKIAYHGNVQLGDFVDPVDPDTTVSIGNVYTNGGLLSALVS